MNNNAPVEIPFAATFPLPFRVLFLAGMGILGWATNLHGLHALGIDFTSALEFRKTADTRGFAPLRARPGFKMAPDPAAVYESIYRLAGAFVAWCAVCWGIFRLVTGGDVELVDVFRYLPAICAMGVLIVLISPFDKLHKRERDMFLYCVRRCISPPSGRPIYFSDVIFADIFTSFAKVLGDVWLSVCMLLPGASLLLLPRQEGLARWIFPTIMSLPYFVRFRQCLIEYAHPSNDGHRPLYNALKYATSFPVIYLSAAQRAHEHIEGEVVTKALHGDALFRLWLLAAAVNSLYSFWWDVTNDWGLSLLKPRPSTSEARRNGHMSPPRPLLLPLMHSESANSSPRSSLSSAGQPFAVPPYAPPHNHTQAQPYGLRHILLYPLPVYPLVIFLNLVLRLTWSVKLSSHLHSNSSEGSVVIFWLEMAEMVRRWMWVFLRVEWEVVKKNGRGPQIGLDEEVDGEGEYDEEAFELVGPNDA
ncbi:hypothetical protein HWV62_24406 [Athelia sp. TMB]|nr:hypothetical protein HWV62_24406 [Athelia sp. TMB]